MYDFAIFVFTGDDPASVRGQPAELPRDNVIFELGLFLGGLERDRAFFIYNETRRPRILTDWTGITTASYRYKKGQDRLEPAVAVATDRILAAVKETWSHECAVWQLCLRTGFEYHNLINDRDIGRLSRDPTAWIANDTFRVEKVIGNLKKLGVTSNVKSTFLS